MQRAASRTTVQEQSWTCLVASLRRLLEEAVARRSPRGVVSAFVETLAVWLEIEVHGYLADTSERFRHAISNVGSDPSRVPPELGADLVPADGALIRLSPAESERRGLNALPGEVLITRLIARNGESWAMVFAGVIDRDETVGNRSLLPGPPTADESQLIGLSDLFREALNALAPETVAPVAAPTAQPTVAATVSRPDTTERRHGHRSFRAWIERLASETIQEGREASVIVISIPEVDVRPEFIQAQVARIRNELRPSDFAGSLADGEIGVLLRDTPADRAAAVSARLEKLLQWDVNSGKAIQPSIGMATWSADMLFDGSILTAARNSLRIP